MSKVNWSVLVLSAGVALGACSTLLDTPLTESADPGPGAGRIIVPMAGPVGDVVPARTGQPVETSYITPVVIQSTAATVARVAHAEATKPRPAAVRTEVRKALPPALGKTRPKTKTTPGFEWFAQQAATGGRHRADERPAGRSRADQYRGKHRADADRADGYRGKHRADDKRGRHCRNR